MKHRGGTSTVTELNLDPNTPQVDIKACREDAVKALKYE